MEKRYYLHRISHEGNVSYSLMRMGYITLGWPDFVDSGILDAAREDGYPRFDIITEQYGEKQSRSRWNMWYFARLNVGDYIVVPLYEGKFSVFEAVELAKPITELESELPSVTGEWEKHTISWHGHRLYDENENRTIGLGFYIKVKPVVENVPRNIVSGELIARMKIRSTNADISDICEHVEKGIEAGKANKPVTLYGEVIDSLVEKLNESICEILDDTKFERLIKWYLEKCGASSAWIPAKNESGKKDGADADVIAEFDNLRYIVYVQAKHHKGVTSAWAVEQIDSYKDQKSEGDPSYTYATWVVSSAGSFSEQAESDAKDNGVRLINGPEFSRMLIDCGLLDIDDAFFSAL